MLRKGRLSADLAITLAFLALFVWAVVQARAWPFRAALFPVTVAAIMLGLVVLKLALDMLAASRPTHPSQRATGPAEEEPATEAEGEAVLSRSPWSTWLAALAWMAGFFGTLWLFGMLVAVPAFAFTYLLVASRESPLAATLYAVGAWALVYGVFDQVVRIPLPQGTLLGVWSP